MAKNGQNKRKIPKGAVVPNKNVKNEINPESVRSSSGFAFDVSFEGLYYSVQHGSFNNYLKNGEQFIEKFREIREFLKKIGDKNFQDDLMRDGGMRHCHQIKEDEKYNLVIKCIEKSLDVSGHANSKIIVTQLLEGEDLYQIGFEGGIRYIGTYDRERNVFRPYLIDYHHKVYPDEKRNKYNERNLNYCVMNSIGE